jgi:ATP-dependent Clp protease adaptor protein ClpS
MRGSADRDGLAGSAVRGGSGTMESMTTPTVAPAPTEETHVSPIDDRPWIVVVWNDPVNLMSYVTYVFQKLFGYTQEKAASLMLDVHQKGRAVVSHGSREQMEHDVARLHAYGLWATLQRDR